MTAREPDAMTIDLIAADRGVDRVTAEIIARLYCLSPQDREIAIRQIRRMVAESQARRRAEQGDAS